jgi:hypothetical protein
LVEDGDAVDMSGVKLPIGRKAAQNRSVSQLENHAQADGKPPKIDLSTVDLIAGTFIPPPLLGLPTIQS